jgi:mannose/fructose-specific phosphotransferase system component IIA
MLSACQQMSSSLDELVVFSIICGTNLPFLVSLLFHVDILYNCVTENNSA